MKRLLRSDVLFKSLGHVVGLYMRFVDATTRWEFDGLAAVEPYWKQGRPIVVVGWHGRIMQMHKCWPRSGYKRAFVLVSQSRDGEAIAEAVHALGYQTVRGSTAKAGKNKGALPALREMLARLGKGETIALTPDGPRGPRQRMGLGAIQLARLSGAPIVPVAWATRHGVTLNSWDRFLVPLPFGRGRFVWGAPIQADRDLDAAGQETLRATIEAELNRLTAAVDQWAHRPVIEPAPVEALAE